MTEEEEKLQDRIIDIMRMFEWWNYTTGFTRQYAKTIIEIVKESKIMEDSCRTK